VALTGAGVGRGVRKSLRPSGELFETWLFSFFWGTILIYPDLELLYKWKKFIVLYIYLNPNSSRRFWNIAISDGFSHINIFYES
jgi:hypothetical protein